MSLATLLVEALSAPIALRLAEVTTTVEAKRLSLNKYTDQCYTVYTHEIARGRCLFTRHRCES